MGPAGEPEILLRISPEPGSLRQARRRHMVQPVVFTQMKEVDPAGQSQHGLEPDGIEKKWPLN